jgi:hypothetical protein
LRLKIWQDQLELLPKMAFTQLMIFTSGPTGYFAEMEKENITIYPQAVAAAATPTAGDEILLCEKRSSGGESVRERASAAATAVTGSYCCCTSCR